MGQGDRGSGMAGPRAGARSRLGTMLRMDRVAASCWLNTPHVVDVGLVTARPDERMGAAALLNMIR